jgi:hypothetical protein
LANGNGKIIKDLAKKKKRKEKEENLANKNWTMETW